MAIEPFSNPFGFAVGSTQPIRIKTRRWFIFTNLGGATFTSGSGAFVIAIPVLASIWLFATGILSFFGLSALNRSKSIQPPGKQKVLIKMWLTYPVEGATHFAALDRIRKKRL